MYKLSKFAHVFDISEKHIAMLRSYDLFTIFIERDFMNIINLLRDGLDYSQCSCDEIEAINNLISLGYVVDCDDIEEEVILKIRDQLKPKLSVLYLILTDMCNLGCRYCFIEAGFPKDYVCSSMTWDVAKKGIDLFISQKDQSMNGEVMFYGGEPFLNYDLLFRCLDYLDEVGPNISRSIITNGTLINETIAMRLSSYRNVSVSVSLDGPKEINDQKRIKKTNEGSCDDVIRGIGYLKSAGINVGISCTIDDHNIDSLSDVLDWIHNEVGTNSLGVNFLVDTPKKFIDSDYMERANAGLLKFFDKNRNEEIYENRVLRKLNAFIRNQPRLNDCAACGKQLVISSSGKIGICHEGLGEGKTFVGAVDSDFDFKNNGQVQEWARRSPFSMQSCLNCEALGICGGGCPYGSMLRYGSIWDVDKRFCIHSKKTLEWLIRDLYDKTMSRIRDELETEK